MDSFRIGLFEVLGAIVPGIPVSIVFVLLLNNHGLDYRFLHSLVIDSGTTSILLFIVMSYSIGFALQYPSYECFKVISKWFWEKSMGKYPTSIGKRGKELSRIRHNSPTNYQILNSFMAHRTMSYNLSFSLSLFSISLWGLYAIDTTKLELSQVIILFFTSVVFSILLIRRAVSFHEWIQRIITETNTIIKKD